MQVQVRQTLYVPERTIAVFIKPQPETFLVRKQEDQMKRFHILLTLLAAAGTAFGGFFPKQISEKSQECIDCHKDEDPGIYQQWGNSKHYRANVGCFECHEAKEGEPDAFKHQGEFISIIVSPKDCGKCHEVEVKELQESHHAKAARILGSLDNILADIVEGNKGLKTAGFPGGVSAVAVNGCWQCHGSEVKTLANGKLDDATWPNTGIGRINPDGSEGSCSACHARHSFSAAQARHPDNCGKCHLGPDHPQREVYEESKHGILFFSNEEAVNLHKEKWVVGEDYDTGPTCASCHMSATPNQPVTHDVGMRISWNNRPITSVRPELSDKKLGLPTADVDWETRRDNMKDVCINCHNANYVDSFYVQYDALVELYNQKFGAPGKELMALAKPMMKPQPFSNHLDYIWFNIWHHEGRRSRHGAAMSAPDYTHWHGLYEVAWHFYHKMIPELEKLIKANKGTQEAKALQSKLDEILNSDNHKWFLGKLDPAEKAKRDKAREEFKKRYSK